MTEETDQNAEIRAGLARLVGRRLPGGCEACDSTHEYVRDTAERFEIWVHHDPQCPVLAAATEPG